MLIIISNYFLIYDSIYQTNIFLCNGQDMLYQWSMPINTDQCRIKFVALTPMPINKYQYRSIKINTDQYFSILINVDQCWSMLDQRLLDQDWSALISIDLYWEVLINIDLHWLALIIIEPHFALALIGIDRHSSLIEHVLKTGLRLHNPNNN